MNKVILLGRLGRAPEVRYTGGGQAVAGFSIATDESYKDRNGEKQKKTEWHNCVAWGKTGENIQRFFGKGGIILVEGKLQTREWQDKEGAKRKSTEIVVFNFGFAGDNGDVAEQAAPQTPPSGGAEISDEDIPF